ncbi:hypothetical protein JCM11251_004863 [Rhodosporidiobolus azoricus]
MPIPTRLRGTEQRRITANLKPRRRKAKQQPLRQGDTLPFSARSTRSDILPTFNRPPSRAVAPLPPRRPVDRALLDALEHAPLACFHRVHLKQPIQEGKDHFSQVWRVEVEAGASKHLAVLKLFVEALFPYPGTESRRIWQRAQIFIDAEVDSYAAFSGLQGSVIPYCYGAYNFALPFGETVPGILLEDLTDIAAPLPVWLARRMEHKHRQHRRRQLDDAGNNSDGSSIDSSDSDVDPEEEILLELKDVQPVLNSIFNTLDHAHAAGRAHLNSDPDDLLVVGTSPSDAYTVTTGFATTCAAEERAEEIRQMYANRSGDELHYSWQSNGWSILFGSVGTEVDYDLMHEFAAQRGR